MLLPPTDQPPVLIPIVSGFKAEHRSHYLTLERKKGSNSRSLMERKRKSLHYSRNENLTFRPQLNTVKAKKGDKREDFLTRLEKDQISRAERSQESRNNTNKHQ